MLKEPASPCTGMCSFERRTGYCIGCARTGSEIIGWRGANAEARGAILAALPARQARLGFVQRLPWSQADIITFIVATLRGDGTWSTGLHGASGAFRRDAGETIGIRNTKTSITAHTARASISFDISSKVRAYAVSASPSADARRVAEAEFGTLVVIAISRSCGFEPGAKGLACLGHDRAAVTDRGRGENLYDFGLGERAGSFGIRTQDAALSQSLVRHLRDEWPDFFPALAPDIARAVPTWVIRNPLGRIEITTGAWADVAHGGPYVQFQPALLMSSGTDPAVNMADSYLPCAVHYPAQ